MYICMSLIIIHLSESAKEVLKMLRSGRIAMSSLDTMYESHDDVIGSKGGEVLFGLK